MKDRILKYVLCALAIFNIADYLFTTRALACGVAEANPIIAATIPSGGFPLEFAVLKLVIAPLICYILWLARGHYQNNKQIISLLVFVTTAYSAVTVWHILGQYFL